ncbi:MAG: hypothetical protein AB1700_00625 [Bacillota bacterium]
MLRRLFGKNAKRDKAVELEIVIFATMAPAAFQAARLIDCREYVEAIKVALSAAVVTLIFVTTLILAEHLLRFPRRRR